jgi:hypothetical protein
MTILSQANAHKPAGGYEIDYSARFNDDDSPELSLTYSITAPWTFSAWVKRGEISAVNVLLGTVGSSPEVQFNAGDTILAEALTTTALFRDPNAWYHIHVSNNGLYINGVSHGSVTTTDLSNAKLFDDFDGYAAEVHLKSGTDAVSNFGELDNEGDWRPKSATAGEHYLTFSNSAALGENSGSGSDWTATNLTSADQVTDTPTNNFCTWNPLDVTTGTFSDGNLVWTSGGTLRAGRATMKIPSTGKWYFEVTPTTIGQSYIGVCTAASTLSSSAENTGKYAFRGPGATLVLNGVDTGSWGTAYGSNDVIGVAIDRDSNKLWFAKNNTWQQSGDPAAGTNPATSSLAADVFPMVGADGTTNVAVANFGQKAFTYTPPTGFSALCTANLPEPTIKDGSAHFQTTIYTGNGSARNIDQTGNSTFQPDLVWIKNRAQADEHMLVDAARGVTKELNSDSTNAESTTAAGLTSFDADGFGLGTGANGYNDNAETFVAWQWKFSASGVANTDGSISSTVYVNSTAKMSIVKWTGTATNGTVGHGLGTTPKLVIIKAYSRAGDQWAVWHASVGTAGVLYLDATSAPNAGDVATTWNSLGPTSSVINVGTGGNSNASGVSYVAYCFAEVEGFCKIGNYTGNGSADGPFVHCGFKPEFVMLKRTNAAGDWKIFDATRSTYNPASLTIAADNTGAESSTTHLCDFVSNGLKHRSTDTETNGSASTYVYIAFAEHPFGGANTVPATAR